MHGSNLACNDEASNYAQAGNCKQPENDEAALMSGFVVRVANLN
jgi:hypothetical protein